jgi:cell division protein FtsQ
MSAEPEYLPADALAEDEPKFLRRQKRVEIRRRKFSRKALPLYRWILLGSLFALSSAIALYEGTVYLLRSPAVLLASDSQIDIQGSRFVPPDVVAEKFSADMGRSVVRVPLSERRKALETIPWVEQAEVQRVLPNRIRVEITERTPVAFLRNANDLSLVDAHGVIVERPAQAEFRFPVVSGISESAPLEGREQRMSLFVQFMREIETTQPGADDRVSEVDLSDASDLRATLTGLGPQPGSASPVLVHFGDSEFADRYRLLTQNIDQWRASAGGVDSVDLRFARQVVVNPEANAPVKTEAKTVKASLKQRSPARLKGTHERR